MMQKVLITGANGLVGYYLLQQMISKDFLVMATSRSANRLPFIQTNFHFHNLDYTNKDAVEQLVSQLKPSVIIHCGAISNADECEQNKEGAFLNNVSGTIHLLKAAVAVKAHFVFLSTDFVFSGDEGLHKEGDERKPVNYYGQTKLLAEDEVKQYPFEWTIVRTVLVYGKSIPGRENFVTTTTKRLQNGEPVKIFEDQLRTLTYAEDLAKGIIHIIEKKASGIYHLAGRERLTLYDAALEIARYFKVDESLVIPIKEGDISLVARRPKKTGLNISKAQKELGYEPLSFLEGLQKTFA